jgi:hypothetical protein
MATNQQTEGFKFYSERNKAKRALIQVYGVADTEVDKYLHKQDAKHGFTLHNGAPIVHDDANLTPAPAPEPVAEVVQPEPQPEPEPEEEEPATPAPSASAFGAFAFGQLTAASNAAAQPATTVQRTEGLKIDKDRTAANGVKERSKGGLCRLVWDTLDGMVKASAGTVPSVGDIKKHAEEQGWNVNNASIEYYQWRKFHGISGRGAKRL